jgi:hypothetical protein
MRFVGAAIVMPFALMATAAVTASGPVTLPAALATLETGQWELRSREPGEPVQKLCVRDLMALFQVRHQGQNCPRFVVEDEPDRTSITYNCPGTGHGRTDMRVETSRLVQIDSQGVADGYPFAISLEGRRVGVCPPVTAKK